MGDAAHATSPAIGMGMNTALRDAQIFCELLKEHNDNFELVLPAYSEARVKEGNALTDLAFHLSCLEPGQQGKEIVHQLVRYKFHMWFPSLVEEHPQTMIGRRGVPLSDVYDQAVKLNIIPKHRAINDKIQQEYFEKKTGMVTHKKKSNWFMKFMVVVGLGALIGGSAYFLLVV